MKPAEIADVRNLPSRCRLLCSDASKRQGNSVLAICFYLVGFNPDMIFGLHGLKPMLRIFAGFSVAT